MDELAQTVHLQLVDFFGALELGARHEVRYRVDGAGSQTVVVPKTPLADPAPDPAPIPEPPKPPQPEPPAPSNAPVPPKDPSADAPAKKPDDKTPKDVTPPDPKEVDPKDPGTTAKIEDTVASVVGEGNGLDISSSTSGPRHTTTLHNGHDVISWFETHGGFNETSLAAFSAQSHLTEDQRRQLASAMYSNFLGAPAPISKQPNGGSAAPGMTSDKQLIEDTVAPLVGDGKPLTLSNGTKLTNGDAVIDWINGHGTGTGTAINDLVAASNLTPDQKAKLSAQLRRQFLGDAPASGSDLVAAATQTGRVASDAPLVGTEEIDPTDPTKKGSVSFKVEPGDNVWNLTRSLMPNGELDWATYQSILQYNKDRGNVTDVNIIQPGQVLELPPSLFTTSSGQTITSALQQQRAQLDKDLAGTGWQPNWTVGNDIANIRKNPNAIIGVFNSLQTQQQRDEFTTYVKNLYGNNVPTAVADAIKNVAPIPVPPSTVPAVPNAPAPIVGAQGAVADLDNALTAVTNLGYRVTNSPFPVPDGSSSTTVFGTTDALITGATNADIIKNLTSDPKSVAKLQGLISKADSYGWSADAKKNLQAIVTAVVANNIPGY